MQSAIWMRSARVRSSKKPGSLRRNTNPIPLLAADDVHFPPGDTALDEPNGLLAVGGDLSPRRLLEAYAHGVFPWFDDDEGPILWWCPDPRCVLFPDELKVSRSLRKRLKSGRFDVTFDAAFPAVIQACRAPRRSQGRLTSGTWITEGMEHAYRRFNELGYAHSVECWHGGELVGGLYGVSLGAMFFGESMFTRETDASKVALVHLVGLARGWDFSLIDCQIANPHLESLGARLIPRSDFLARLGDNRKLPTRRGSWHQEAEKPA